MAKFTSGIAAALLAFMAICAWGAAQRGTVTFDEIAHIGAGLSYVQKLDMRFNEEHPPLSKVFAGISMAIGGVRADYASPVWKHSSSFFSGMAGQWIFGTQLLAQWNDVGRTLVLARLPMLTLMLILGWCVFQFARRLGGNAAGLLCLTVYVGSPLFLAMGPLVITDVAMALFGLLTTWTLAGLWENPTRRNTILFSLSLGAALLTKFSAAILLPGVVAVAAVLWLWPAERGTWRRERLTATLKGVLLAALWVYLFTLFLSWNQPADMPALEGNRILSRLAMPVWVFIRGVTLFLVMQRRTGYILGQVYYPGVWFYFPVLLLLKSPPGFIGLLLLLPSLAIKAVFGRRPSQDRRAPSIHHRALWIMCAVFTAACVMSRFNTDFRHLSLPVVLLILLLSAVPSLVRQIGARAARIGVAGLTAILAVSCLASAALTYPFYIPYVNVLGLNQPRYMLFAGGNLDWNQSLPEAGRFARAHGLTSVPLTASGMSAVTPWVKEARPWNCQYAESSPNGMWVVVSANVLMHGSRCLWMLRYPHQMLGGGSMYAVHLPPELPAPGTSGRPPAAPASSLKIFGIDKDLQTLYLELVNHPERFPETIAPVDGAARIEARRKLDSVLRILHLRDH